VDGFTTVTQTIETFVTEIQQSLITGTLNFEEALCNSANTLVSSFKDLDSNQLLSVNAAKNADKILDQLKEVCEDTTVTDDDVKRGKK
jgi:hypothetical protein